MGNLTNAYHYTALFLQGLNGDFPCPSICSGGSQAAFRISTVITSYISFVESFRRNGRGN